MTLSSQLNTLEAADLIRLAATQPDLQYIFRHTLVQDVTYASLVRADRQALHLATGEALEHLYPDQRGELAPVLGRHFDEAGDKTRALKYYSLAGDRAAQHYANAEAVTHYSRALEIAKKSAAADHEQILQLYSHRGRALELSSQFEAALDNYDEMEALARARGDQAMELAALTARATLRSTPSSVLDPERAQALSDQALALARSQGDRAAEAKILWNFLRLNWFTGHAREAVAFGEQAAAIARELGLRELLAYTLNDLASFGYMSTGQYDRVLATLEEAGDLWRSLGNLPMLADNLGRYARALFTGGKYEAALAASEEAHQISQSTSNLWGQSFCRMFVGYVYLEYGQPAQAIDLMEECVRLGEQAGFTMVQVGTRADLGWIYGSLGAIDHGLELAHLAGQVAEQHLPRFRPWTFASLARLYVMQGDLPAAEAAIRQGRVGLDPENFITHAPIEMPLAEAELALASGDHARAVTLMDELLARMRRVGVRPFVADALCLKGQALLAEGRPAEARDTLLAARAEAEALGSRRSLWPVLASLGQVEAYLGHEAEAQALRRQAREIVESIASQAGTPQLSASFLASPSVRALTD